MLTFLTDVMLLKLGRWLRILGVRANAPENIDDDAILFQTLRERSVLLTMDRELAERARKADAAVLYLPPTCLELEEQLKLIHSSYPFDIENETLCTSCGAELAVRDSRSMLGKVPESVVQRFDKVRVCSGCGQVFWEGSHWKNINKIISKVRRWAST
jgi:hypothetical protein